uniref:Uncharacterized protein n=1 Tax=viral metagenome TaxID=1070528 RepID=A0A6M3IRT2_9ZZZZ
MLGKLKNSKRVIQNICKFREYIIKDNRFNPIFLPLGIKKEKK